MLHGQIGVGQGLGLNALRGVHDEHRPLTGGQGAGYLIVEVHMARGVDEVQGVGAAVLRLVVQTDGPGLDGDATLPLQVHVVQQLALHLPGGDGVALLQQPVRQRGLAVVDMGNDAEISDVALFCHIRIFLHRPVHARPASRARRASPFFQSEWGPHKIRDSMGW